MEKQNHIKKQKRNDRRQTVIDRRLDLNRHRGPGKRRTDDRKSAEEGSMSDEQFEFLMTIDKYKTENNIPFPTWTEILELIKAIGYRKIAEPQSIGQAKDEEVEIAK